MWWCVVFQSKACCHRLSDSLNSSSNILNSYLYSTMSICIYPCTQQTGQPMGSPIQDHYASIRSIAAVPGISGFLTTSNDGMVVLRAIGEENTSDGPLYLTE